MLSKWQMLVVSREFGFSALAAAPVAFNASTPQQSSELNPGVITGVLSISPTIFRPAKLTFRRWIWPETSTRLNSRAVSE